MCTFLLTTPCHISLFLSLSLSLRVRLYLYVLLCLCASALLFIYLFLLLLFHHVCIPYHAACMHVCIPFLDMKLNLARLALLPATTAIYLLVFLSINLLVLVHAVLLFHACQLAVVSCSVAYLQVTVFCLCCFLLMVHSVHSAANLPHLVLCCLPSISLVSCSDMLLTFWCSVALLFLVDVLLFYDICIPCTLLLVTSVCYGV
jgi:hypothetical protein